MYHEPEIRSGRLEAHSTGAGSTYTQYQSTCSCGWTGPIRISPHEADYDSMEHRIAENEE